MARPYTARSRGMSSGVARTMPQVPRPGLGQASPAPEEHAGTADAGRRVRRDLQRRASPVGEGEVEVVGALPAVDVVGAGPGTGGALDEQRSHLLVGFEALEAPRITAHVQRVGRSGHRTSRRPPGLTMDVAVSQPQH